MLCLCLCAVSVCCDRCLPSDGSPDCRLQGYAFPAGLTVLNLEDNVIADWDAVAGLGNLPVLAELNLGRNQIAAVGSVPAGVH